MKSQGDTSGSYYLEGGSAQFAEITDFDRTQGDLVNVFGQITDYSFSYDPTAQQTDLFFKDVRIAQFNTLDVDTNNLIFG